MFTELQNDIARRLRSWSSPARDTSAAMASRGARTRTDPSKAPKGRGSSDAPLPVDTDPAPSVFESLRLAPEFLSRYSLLILDADGCVQNWNENMRQLLGYDEDEIIGAHVSVFCTEQDQQSGATNVELGTAASTGHYCGTGLRRHKDGRTFQARVQVTAMRDNRQRMSGFIELIQAAEGPLAGECSSNLELRRSVERLHQESESMRALLAVIGDGVITTDANGLVTSLNPVAEQITGWGLHEALGKPASSVFQVVNDSTRQPESNPVARALYKARIIELEGSSVLLSRDGSRRVVEDTCAPVFDQDQQVTGAVLVFRDVTSTHRHTRELQHQAEHDALTGLVNRTEFERRLQRVLDAPGGSHVLFYLDLDRFKAVNDTCGHPAGDELLHQVAALIESKVRNRDTVARIGGDEFAILLEHCELQQAMRIAEAIHNTLGQHPFVLDHKSFNIGVSVGVVALAGGNWTVAQLIETADSACYAAKQSEGLHIHVHDGQGEQRSSIAAQVNWEKRLRRALTHNLFQLHFQPITRLAGKDSSSLRGEILLRLADDSDGLVRPRAFLTAAERCRLMPEIDQWVLRRLLTQLKPYAAQLAAGTALISVNLSAQSIASKEFLNFIEHELASCQLPPECLCFEIAEEAATCNLRACLQFMEVLHQRHHRLALDNFGSGLSSFDHLRALPIDFLKINGNLIRDIASDPVDTAIVDAMHRVGRLLGVPTIAVAAETDAILNQIKSVGIEYVQGFSIARPQLLESRLTAFALT